MGNAATLSTVRVPGFPERKVKRMAASPESGRFKDVVLRLFQGHEEYLRKTGTVDLMRVSDALPDVYYETLRKAVAGDRQPSVDLMEKVATLAGVDPGVFAEYQLEVARQQFDPKVVGWETATANLKAWAEASTRPRRKRS